MFLQMFFYIKDRHLLFEKILFYVKLPEFHLILIIKDAVN
jgi:hypothetical protein